MKKVVDDADIDVVIVSNEEKVATVIFCLSKEGQGTIKSLRNCTSKYMSIGDKLIKNVLYALFTRNLIVFDHKKRKWVPTNLPKFNSIEDALHFINEINLEIS